MKAKILLKLTQKLNTNQKCTKARWARLKVFLNNRKMPVIAPFFHNNKFVTDFKEKAEPFNYFFAKQCSWTKTDSKLRPNWQEFVNGKIRKYWHVKDNPES